METADHPALEFAGRRFRSISLERTRMTRKAQNDSHGVVAPRCNYCSFSSPRHHSVTIWTCVNLIRLSRRLFFSIGRTPDTTRHSSALIRTRRQRSGPRYATCVLLRCRQASAAAAFHFPSADSVASRFVRGVTAPSADRRRADSKALIHSGESDPSVRLGCRRAAAFHFPLVARLKLTWGGVRG